MADTWQDRIDAVWDDASLSEADRLAAIDAVAAERAPDDAIALFERAGARDAAGLESDAEPLYRAALEQGLDDERRTRAVVQLASTLRNLGRVEEARDLLGEAYATTTGALRDAVAAFYALTLVSAGEPVHAASVALTALAPHLPLYTRSVRAYAAELAESTG